MMKFFKWVAFIVTLQFYTLFIFATEYGEPVFVSLGFLAGALACSTAALFFASREVE